MLILRLRYLLYKTILGNAFIRWVLWSILYSTQNLFISPVNSFIHKFLDLSKSVHSFVLKIWTFIKIKHYSKTSILKKHDAWTCASLMNISKIIKQTCCEKIIGAVIIKPYRDINTESKFIEFSTWAAPSEFGTNRLCEQRRFRRACASAQSRQNLRCSLIQAVSQEEPSDRKPDPWPLWMAGHAQLKLVMTECSKTQIRLTGLN